VAAITIVALPAGSIVWGQFFTALKAGLGTSAAVAGGAAGGFASGFSGSLLNGGSVGEAFKAGALGAVVGAATAWAAGQIGGFFEGLGDGVGTWSGRTLSHATVGGLAAEVQGGEFRHGFYASAASAGFSHSAWGRSLMRSEHLVVRTTVAATIGGTASIIGGGKFANGAVTSAFQHLFNEEAHKAEKPRGIMFLRLNQFESEKKIDGNARFWEELVTGLRDDLVRKGEIKEHQLMYVRAMTMADVLDKLRFAVRHNYEVVISSHGHPIDSDLKAMFGKDPYRRQDFMASVNKTLETTVLTPATVWYSCDRVWGANSPTTIFNERAKHHVEHRLWQINQK